MVLHHIKLCHLSCQLQANTLSRAAGTRLRQVLEDLREAARFEALREAQRQRVGVAGARVSLPLQRRQPRQPRLLVVYLGPAGNPRAKIVCKSQQSQLSGQMSTPQPAC